MTDTMMLLSMTPTAKRYQIVQIIISGLSRACHAVPVYVVNLKVVLCAAVLAGVVVTLQGGFAVSAEMIIVSGLIGVLLQAVFVRSKPFMDSANLSFALALWASVLWARLVRKILATFRAVQDSAYWSLSLFKSKLTQCFNILLLAVGWLAGGANLLARTCRNVFGRTHGAFSGVVRHSNLHSRIFPIIA